MKDKKLKAMLLSDKLRNQIADIMNDFQKENAVGVGFVMTALLQFTADIAVQIYKNINDSEQENYCKYTTQKTLEFINTRFAEIDAENNEEA